MEELAKNITLCTSHAAEILAAVIIAFAILKVLYNYGSRSLPGKLISTENTRAEFGSSVAVALELMLGADVLTTAVAPSWDDIGKLAAIAVIRTALNYFLEKELRSSRESVVGSSESEAGSLKSVAGSRESVGN